jgi:hypothetical protein
MTMKFCALPLYMGAAINQLVSYVEKKQGKYMNVPVSVAAYNLKSNVFCRKYLKKSSSAYV